MLHFTPPFQADPSFRAVFFGTKDSISCLYPASTRKSPSIRFATGSIFSTKMAGFRASRFSTKKRANAFQIRLLFKELIGRIHRRFCLRLIIWSLRRVWKKNSCRRCIRESKPGLAGLTPLRYTYFLEKFGRKLTENKIENRKIITR